MEKETIEATGDDRCKPININVEDGGNCTVNIEITHSYNTYTYPEWVTDELYKWTITTLHGGKA